VNDRAIRLSRVIAQFRRRDRDAEDAVPDDGSAVRRHELKRTATSLRARVAAVHARRRRLSNE